MNKFCITFFIHLGFFSPSNVDSKQEYEKYVLNIISGHKNGATASISIKLNFFKLNTQILQMRYQNVQEGSNFSVKRKKL